MADEIMHPGDVDDWNVYRKCCVVSDVTEVFIERSLPACRTVDQMRQAARSGKQNLVEGLSDMSVSFEMGFRLIGIARGSYRELREDYRDFLRQHGMEIWSMSDHRTMAWRKYATGADAMDVREFTALCTAKRPVVTANVMITLISQIDAAITSLMKELEDEFRQTGGVKEKLGRMRRTWRMDNKGY